MNDQRPDYQFRVILLGNAGAGKSCIISRLVDSNLRGLK